MLDKLEQKRKDLMNELNDLIANCGNDESKRSRIAELDREVDQLSGDISIARKQEQRSKQIESDEVQWRTKQAPNAEKVVTTESKQDETFFQWAARSLFEANKNGYTSTPKLRASDINSGLGNGNLIGVQFATEINKLMAPMQVVRPKAKKYPGLNPLVLPLLSSDGTNGYFGGMTCDWIEEGGLKPQTDFTVDNVTLVPHELAARVKVTDKFLRSNIVDIQNFISQQFIGLFANAEDEAFLTGDGTGKPLGILNSGALKEVTRDTTGDILFEDILNMVGGLLPSSRAANSGSLCWIINPALTAKIYGMKTDGTTGDLVLARNGFIGDRPVESIMGIPVNWCGYCSDLGSVGDIILADFNYYAIRDGYGVSIQASEHENFSNNITVIKCFKELDGAPIVDGPVKYRPSDTATYSPFVALS